MPTKLKSANQKAIIVIILTRGKQMALIKYFFLAVLGIGIFILGALGLDAKDWIYKGGYILAFIVGLLILNFFAKIAWRFLILLLLVFLTLYTLSHFGIIEISLPSFTDFVKGLFTIKPETASAATSATAAK